MTSKRFFSFGLIIAAMLTALTAWAKMTDQQVIDYIKRQSAVGKTEQQIGKELLAKGVTPEQIERLRENTKASNPTPRPRKARTAPPLP